MLPPSVLTRRSSRGSRHHSTHDGFLGGSPSEGHPMASATWLSSPGSNDFDTGSNWSTGTAPGSNDTAVFDGSSVTSLTFSGSRIAGTFQFNSDASNYSFTLSGTASAFPVLSI